MPNAIALPSREWLVENLKYEPETGLFWWLKAGAGRRMSEPAGSKRYQSGERAGEPCQIAIRLQGRRYPAHRLAWLMTTGEDPAPLTVDHISRDPFDNRWVNLRLADHSLQQRNKRKQIGCSSRYKGVSYHKATRKWLAYVYVGGKRNNLGFYATEEEAAAVAAPFYISQSVPSLSSSFLRFWRRGYRRLLSL